MSSNYEFIHKRKKKNWNEKKKFYSQFAKLKKKNKKKKMKRKKKLLLAVCRIKKKNQERQITSQILFSVFKH